MLAVCEPQWLTKALTDATEDTGVPEWLAVDVSRGVEAFLRNHYDGTVIDFDDLFERIRLTLNGIGLGEIAANLEVSPPKIRISLTDLARRAGSGYELMFFDLLKSRFRSAAGGGVRDLDCYGLRACVRHLTATKRWTRNCGFLESEISEFLHGEQRKASLIFPELRLTIFG